jgi:hypothetical protein
LILLCLILSVSARWFERNLLKGNPHREKYPKDNTTYTLAGKVAACHISAPRRRSGSGWEKSCFHDTVTLTFTTIFGKTIQGLRRSHE